MEFPASGHLELGFQFRQSDPSLCTFNLNSVFIFKYHPMQPHVHFNN